MNASPLCHLKRLIEHREPASPFVVYAVLGLAFVLTAGSLTAQAAPPQAPPAADTTVTQSATPSPQASSSQTASDKNAPEITTRQDNDSTFKVNVNLVVVRVVVRDKLGRAVGTLKQEDFQLLDNGKPQTIARFAVEQTANVLPPGGKGEPVAKPVAPERYLAYLFDDIHLQAADIDQARTAAIRHLNTLSPTDRAAIYTTSGITMLDFTDDRAKLTDALLRVKPSPISSWNSVHNCPDISLYMADLIRNKHDAQALRVATQDANDCMQLRSNLGQAQNIVLNTADQVLDRGHEQTTLALGTLRDVVRKMALMPGQRTVVLLSPGFLLISDNTYTENTIVESALRSNVTLSTLDARGLNTVSAVGDISQSRTPGPNVSVYINQYSSQSDIAQSNLLSELAYGTGGTYFHNNNDLQEGFRRTAEAPEFYYVLGFAPQSLKNDGSYHSLKVTLKEKQPYSLQARKGYYAPKRSESLAEQAKSDINDAVFSQEQRKDMPVELETKFFKTSGEAAKLAVLVKVDVRRLHYQKVNGRNRNDLTIVSALFDRNGNFIQGDQKTLEMRLTDETLDKKLNSGVILRANFDVKPGSYLVRCVVRDNDGALSAANDSVEIP